MTLSLLAITCLLAITLGYGVTCWLSPFGDCRKCNGVGHLIKFDRKGTAKRGKTCRRCRGIGKRIRVGRHLYNVGRHAYRAGTR
ncbi:hypothetical protein [Streptomyces sp. NPDC052225]|uniref:hypothetical protein n=1 Tax=Streptomyces sp. NPDC052225 TaxID=3154949 RepID=UPI00343D1B33